MINKKRKKEGDPLFLLAFKIFVLFSIFSAVARFASAETPQESFKRGNDLYAQGKFADAASAYEQARAADLHHWALDYNLGDAYFKTGQLGRAIASFERAFRLNSSQRDVIANLRLVSERAGDPVVPQSALPALLWRLFYAVSLNTLTVLCSLLFFACLGVAAWSLYQRRSALSAEGWAGLLSVFLIIGLCLAARIEIFEKPTGVIVASPNAEARSGPNSSYPASFTVPEGRHVLILEDQEPVQGWLEVGVPQEGLKGWIPSTSVDRI